MWGFLRPDSKFILYANKFCDLIALNLVMLVFCIPVFTIGTSITAMHYVLLKILRDELSGGVIRNFWNSFKSNFKQATRIWLIYLPVGALILWDLLMFHKGLLTLPTVLKYLLIVLGVLWMISLNWSLILQSRYVNPIKATIRNSLLFCLFHPLDTLLINAVLCIPFVLIILLPQLTPVVLFCGFGLSGMLGAGIYSRIFTWHESELSKEIENNERR